MANPSAPPRTFAAMHSRAGYADGSVLTTAELDLAASLLLPGDGTGNFGEIDWVYIGPYGGIGIDVSDAVWITRNAYPNTTGGVTSWYPFVETTDSIALYLGNLGGVSTATLFNIYYAAALNGDGAITWTQVGQFNTTGLAGLASEIAARISGDTANAAAIASETARAESAEGVTSSMAAANGANISALQTLTAQQAAAITLLNLTVAAMEAQINVLSFEAKNWAAGGPVKAATAAPLPACTYVHVGTGGITGVGDMLIGLSTAALPSQDGIAINVTDRLLVWQQAAALQNGLYTLTQQGDGVSLPWILTRAVDADTNTELGGIQCVASQGTSYANNTFLLPLAAALITVGVTALAFVIVGTGALAPGATQHVSVNYSAAATDGYLRVDTSAGDVVITLYAVTAAIRGLKVKKISTDANAIRFAVSDGALIDGAPAAAFVISQPMKSVVLDATSHSAWDITD